MRIKLCALGIYIVKAPFFGLGWNTIFKVGFRGKGPKYLGQNPDATYFENMYNDADSGGGHTWSCIFLQ